MKMKIKTLSTLKLFSFLLLTLSAPALARAQGGPNLQMESLNHLTSRASQTVVISVDERVLKAGAPFLKSSDPDEAKIKELLKDVKGIYVKTFAFENEGEFSDADLQGVRSQLNSPEWSKIIEARSRKEDVTVEVFVKTDDAKVGGIAVIAYGSKDLTVVNIVGFVDMDKLRQMEGQFGIPDLELERGAKERKPQPDEKD
jgi:hypothetical protein